MNCRLILVASLLVVCLCGSSLALADVKANDNVVVKADETIEDDFYVVGDVIKIEGIIKGDLLAAGREIVISGTVEGDVMATAQTITIEGKVLDDVRIAGQTLFLKPGADIGDDLSAAGFSLDCAAETHVGGEVHFGGYQATYAGDVDQNLNSATANCLLSGRFGRNVDVVADGGDYQPPFFFMQTPVSPIPAGLTIEGTTVIDGDLSYRARSEASKDSEAQISGTVEFNHVNSTSGGQADVAPTITQRLISAGKYFGALFVVGLLLVTAFPVWTKTVAGNIQSKPIASIGWGLVGAIAIPVIAIFLLVATIAVAILLGFISLESLIVACVTVGTFSTAALVAGFTIFAVWISKVVVSLWAGARVTNLEHWNLKNSIIALIVGLLIYVVLDAIPWFGSIFSLLVTLCGIGAATIWFFKKSKSRAEGTLAEKTPVAPVKTV